MEKSANKEKCLGCVEDRLETEPLRLMCRKQGWICEVRMERSVRADTWTKKMLGH